MTRINLLPPEIIERQKASRKVTYFSGGLIALVLLLTLVYLMLVWRVSQENVLLQQLKGDNQRLKDIVAGYKTYQDKQNELQRREKILTQAIENRLLWSHILNEISMVIPSDVWLNSFTGDVTSGISVRGYTFDHPTVAKWMIRQGEIKKLTEVELRLSQKTELEAQKVIEFETGAKLVGITPPVATPGAAPKK